MFAGALNGRGRPSDRLQDAVRRYTAPAICSSCRRCDGRQYPVSFISRPAGGVNFAYMFYYGAMNDKDSLLEFPCTFPIKAMGRCDSGFEATALTIVRRHVPDFDVQAMRTVSSRQGNFLSVTFTIEATSREQLDNLYRELTACEDLLMVL
jgi:putative lipoic acid-binding regulatory protein